jgi:hypothetical protein
MARRALDAFEEGADGTWTCMKDAVVTGCLGAVRVQRGQTFKRNTAFAGFSDFPAYLASISEDRAPLAPHEW